MATMMHIWQMRWSSIHRHRRSRGGRLGGSRSIVSDCRRPGSAALLFRAASVWESVEVCLPTYLSLGTRTFGRQCFPRRNFSMYLLRYDPVKGGLDKYRRRELRAG